MLLRLEEDIACAALRHGIGARRLRVPATAHGMDVVRFVTPTSDAERLQTILPGASGYLYYVSMTGITGTRAIAAADVKAAITSLRENTALPVTVGFGIKTPEQAGEVAKFADGVVVGTAIVARVFECVGNKLARAALVSNVAEFCTGLSKSVHAAREPV